MIPDFLLTLKQRQRAWRREMHTKVIPDVDEMNKFRELAKSLNQIFTHNHYYPSMRIKPFYVAWADTQTLWVICDNPYIHTDDIRWKALQPLYEAQGYRFAGECGYTRTGKEFSRILFRIKD